MDFNHPAGPRFNAKMRTDVTTTYDKALYASDDGLWTIYEIVKRPVAKVADEASANRLITLLEKAGSDFERAKQEGATDAS